MTPKHPNSRQFQPLRSVETPELPRPASRHAYLDSLFLWSFRTLTVEQLVALRKLCGSVIVLKRHHAHIPRWRRLYCLHQPTPAALNWLDRHLVNDRGQQFDVARLDLALDVCFDTHHDLAQADDLFRRYQVQPRHGKREIKHYRDGGRTFGRGHDRRNLATYPESFSRLTGELHCLHVEVRYAGMESVRRALQTPQVTTDSLRKIDYRAVIERELRLVRIDPERLGRRFLNRLEGTRRRRPCYTDGRMPVNLDRFTGSQLMKKANNDRHGTTAQRIVEQLDGDLIRSAQTILDVTCYLPDGEEAAT